MTKRIKGEILFCDRCEDSIFLKYLGTDELDGGFTHNDKFEKPPEDWLYVIEVGWLCPKCAQKFKVLMSDFFRDKVPEKWRNTPEEG